MKNLIVALIGKMKSIIASIRKNAEEALSWLNAIEKDKSSTMHSARLSRQLSSLHHLRFSYSSRLRGYSGLLSVFPSLP